MSAKDRLIVALDVANYQSAREIVRETREYVGTYKIGLELISTGNVQHLVGSLHHGGSKIFYDAKFNDIPNTVARAVKAAAGLGVDMVNVHALCGSTAMRAAVEAGRAHSRPGGFAGHEVKIVAVTVLTSLDAGDLTQLGFDPAKCGQGIHGCSDQELVGIQVVKLAKLAQDAGIEALICSPQDILAIQEAGLRELRLITPGVRPNWAAANDQKRVMTPGEAILAGANMLVVGRPVTNPPDGMTRAEAAKVICEEIETAEKQLAQPQPPLLCQ